MKTAISLPDDLFELGERTAKRLGVSRSELYARALAAFLREQRAEATRAAVDRVLRKHSPPRLDEVLARAQAMSLGPDEGPLEDWVDLDAARSRRQRRLDRADG